MPSAFRLRPDRLLLSAIDLGTAMRVGCMRPYSAREMIEARMEIRMPMRSNSCFREVPTPYIVLDAGERRSEICTCTSVSQLPSPNWSCEPCGLVVDPIWTGETCRLCLRCGRVGQDHDMYPFVCGHRSSPENGNQPRHSELPQRHAVRVSAESRRSGRIGASISLLLVSIVFTFLFAFPSGRASECPIAFPGRTPLL